MASTNGSGNRSGGSDEIGFWDWLSRQDSDDDGNDDSLDGDRDGRGGGGDDDPPDELYYGGPEWGLKFRHIPQDDLPFKTWRDRINDQRAYILLFWDLINPEVAPHVDRRAVLLRNLAYLADPWRNISDKVSSYAKHIFSRSRSFTKGHKALIKRLPGVFVSDEFSLKECDACRRVSKHQKKIHLGGRPYDRDTLIPIDEEDEEDEVEVTLGTTCLINTTESHSMYHKLFKVYQRFARSCMPAIEQLSNSGEIAQFYDEERLFDVDQFQEYMDLDHDHRSFMFQVRKEMKAFYKRRMAPRDEEEVAV